MNACYNRLNFQLHILFWIDLFHVPESDFMLVFNFQVYDAEILTVFLKFSVGNMENFKKNYPNHPLNTRIYFKGANQTRVAESMDIKLCCTFLGTFDFLNVYVSVFSVKKEALLVQMSTSEACAVDISLVVYELYAFNGTVMLWM